MFRSVVVALAWLSLAFITFATLSPIQDRPALGSVGLLQIFSDYDHYIAFAVIGGLFGLAYPRQTLFVCLVVFGAAIVLELAQLLTPDRHARVTDAMSKIVGGAIGMALAHLSLRLYGTFKQTAREATDPDGGPNA